MQESRPRRWVVADSVQPHRATVLSHRLARGFEYAHDAQPRLAAGDRPLIALNAAEKMADFRLKCLGQLEPRRPHVARAVTHEHLVDAFYVCVGNGDAAIVHLDLLARFDVVVNDHLARTAD